ncbi:MAG: DUF1963 domain-containing protein [Candidatus Saccharibacteria bacterium]
MSIMDNIFGKRKPLTPENNNTSGNSAQQSNLEERLKKTMELLDTLKRTAYLPVTAVHENSFSDQSKIGGFPYLRNADDWPVCPNCQQHMHLFLQLNLEQLPEQMDQGLIQLFYCTTKEPNCETQLKAFQPFSKASVCRRIEVNGNSAIIEAPPESTFEEKLITAWEPKEDYPHPDEYEQLGLEADDEVLEIIESKGFGFTIAKDKLFGWPYWVQSVEYPSDRKTNDIMQLLFQLDSEDNLPYMFGDSGVGHVTQSPANKEEVAFGWACY